MTHLDKANLYAALLVWAVLGLVGAVAWAMTIGKWMREEREARAEGVRALEIADEYRRLQIVTGMQGEAWTYEQAALHWEQMAQERGVRRTDPRTEPDPIHSQASPTPPKPFETPVTARHKRFKSTAPNPAAPRKESV